MPYWLEVVLAGLLLVLLSPLLLIVALVVALTSPGPVLFGQQRLGRNGVPFTLLKFRTMTVGAESGGRLSIGNDPRVTRAGRFLRAHRLDELPQLLNVVRGDMALIGARPEVPEFAGDVADQLHDLLQHRPGLTDPASLAYRDEAELLAAESDPEAYYRQVVLPAKLALSADYARRRTLRSDTSLLLRTAALLLPARVTAPLDAGMRRTVRLTFLSDWLPKLLSLIVLLVLARRLGAGVFATFAVALSWINYAWWAVDLGQAGYSIRTLALAKDEDQRRNGSEILSLYIFLALVVSAGLVVLLAVLGLEGSPQRSLLLAMTPYLLCYALYPDWWLRARGMLHTLGLANWSVAVALGLAVVILSPGAGIGYAIAYGLAPLAGAGVALVALVRAHSRPQWLPSWHAWSRHLKTSLKFSAAGAGGQIAVTLALVTMVATGDPRAAGAFAIGLRVAASAANALWLLLHNALPQLLGERRHVGRRALMSAAGIPLAGLAVSALLWQPVILPLLGPSFIGFGAYAALGAALLVVWGPRYLVEIQLITSFRDGARIAMNLVTPCFVIGAWASGLAVGRSWVMPVALLVGEAAATSTGALLLRRSRKEGAQGSVTHTTRSAAQAIR